MHVWNALPFAPMAKGSRDQGMILRRDFVDHIKSLRDHHHRQPCVARGLTRADACLLYRTRIRLAKIHSLVIEDVPRANASACACRVRW